MKRNRRLLLHTGLLMAVLGGIAPVIHAASVTTTLPITVTIPAVCTVSATAVNFGTFMGAAVNANGSVSVTCAIGTNYQVALDAGIDGGPSGSPHERAISGAFGYNLFQDSGLTLEWGDICPGGGSTHSGQCFASSGTGVAQVLTVYGRLAASNTLLHPGTYSDTVLVTVIF